MIEENLIAFKNAVDAKQLFEKAGELKEIEKIEKGTNKYHIKTDKAGFNTDYMDSWILVEVMDTWVSSDNETMAFDVKLWIVD